MTTTRLHNTPTHTGHRQRLRNKFIAAGLDGFLEHEVLELLLTYIIPRKDTKPIAWALLKKFGSVPAVLDATPQQLIETDGVGEQTAQFLKLIRGIIKHYSFGKVKQNIAIHTPQQILNYCKASLRGKQEECVEIIFLSIRNTIIGTQVLSSGLIDCVAVSPRKIVESALTAKATALFLVHNHPSGDATPSPEDISLTLKTIRAAQLFDISVRDHIIIGKNGNYYSMRAQGDI